MIVSADIGTSYSSICSLGPDGKAHPIDIGTGSSMFGSKYSLPSAVFLEDSGRILVGQAAMNSRRHKPQNFHMEFKRSLGEEIPILLGEHRFKPEELYTELFRHMKERAEKLTGEAIEMAYLTYPASYGQRRREKLCAAAKAAGLFQLELVDEPTAAAMCYCAEGYVAEGETLLVYDFGGGTFDVSLVRYENGAFQLLSEPLGLERCGGMDIDFLIAQDMRQTLEEALPGVWDNLQKNRVRFHRFSAQLNELAVKAKHHLSSADSFEEYIEVELEEIRYRLDRERFDGMIAPLVGQTIQTCRQALDEAGIAASEISSVLMVGGTSRIPLVQEMVRKITGKPALCAADLELIVAQGALMYRESRKSTPAPEEPSQETQVQPHQEEALSKGFERLARPARRSFPDGSDREAVLDFYRENTGSLISCCNASWNGKSSGSWYVWLRPDGRVMARGNNSRGQCNVEGWSDIVSIACGEDFTVGLRADGTVAAVGENLHRQNDDVKGWRDIIAIACGDYHVVGLRADGTVTAAGHDGDDRCHVAYWHDVVSIACGYNYTVGLFSDGTVVTTVKKRKVLSSVQSWRDVTAIACSRGAIDGHTVGMRADGTVVTAGSNAFGLGNVKGWRNMVSVGCGRYHTVGLRSDGTVAAVGTAADGACHVQNWRDIVSISCGEYHTVGLRSDGSVVAVGRNDRGQCNVQNCCDIAAIQAGRDRTILLKKDGTLISTDFTTEKKAAFLGMGTKLADQPAPPRVIDQLFL